MMTVESLTGLLDLLLTCPGITITRRGGGRGGTKEGAPLLPTASDRGTIGRFLRQDSAESEGETRGIEIATAVATGEAEVPVIRRMTTILTGPEIGLRASLRIAAIPIQGLARP